MKISYKVVADIKAFDQLAYDDKSRLMLLQLLENKLKHDLTEQFSRGVDELLNVSIDFYKEELE